MSFIREFIEKPIIDRIKKKRSKYWRKVRKNFLKENPTCACCGRKKGLEIHHIKDFSTNPKLELDPNNLITLCGKTCHILFGHLRNWKSINPNIKLDAKRFLKKIQNRR